MKVTKNGVIIDSEGLVDNCHEGGMSLVAVVETTVHGRKPDMEAFQKIGVERGFFDGAWGDVARVEIAVRLR